MSASSFDDLAQHNGHEIQCVTYGNASAIYNAAVECVTCGTVLLDFDNPNPHRK